MRAEVLKNGVSIASGERVCIEGVTRNPARSLEVLVFVPFGSIADGDGDLGPADTLSLRVSARIGSDGSGGFCGGHANATGLRLYFDSATRDANLQAVVR